MSSRSCSHLPGVLTGTATILEMLRHITLHVSQISVAGIQDKQSIKKSNKGSSKIYLGYDVQLACVELLISQLARRLAANQANNTWS